MKFSVTDIELFKRCRRQWHLSSISEGRLGLTPIMTESVALDLGSLIHKTLASWIADSDSDPIKFFLGHANDRMEESIANYKEIVGVAPSDFELDKLYEAIDLGKVMMENYREHHKSPLPRNMVYKSPEQAVQIAMPGTEHPCEHCYGQGTISYTTLDGVNRYSHEALVCEECGGTGIQYHILTCTFDGLLQDMRDNILILEHKTYSKTPNKDVLRRVDQFCGYLWIANQIGKVAGWKVRGLAYDGMLKRKTPPKGKSLADMFIRTTLDRSQTAMDNWAIQAAECMNDMASMPFDINSGILYPHVPWNGCWECKVKKICDAVDEGEDWEYIAKRNFTRRKVEEFFGESSSNN